MTRSCHSPADPPSSIAHRFDVAADRVDRVAQVVAQRRQRLAREQPEDGEADRAAGERERQRPLGRGHRDEADGDDRRGADTRVELDQQPQGGQGAAADGERPGRPPGPLLRHREGEGDEPEGGRERRVGLDRADRADDEKGEHRADQRTVAAPQAGVEDGDEEELHDAREDQRREQRAGVDRDRVGAVTERAVGEDDVAAPDQAFGDRHRQAQDPGLVEPRRWASPRRPAT